MKFAATLFLLSATASAAPNQAIQCSRIRDLRDSIIVNATLASPSRLECVKLDEITQDGVKSESTYPGLDAKSDADEISPLEGIRFYFHSGNTSTFLLLPSAAPLKAIAEASPQALRDADQGDHRFFFMAQFVFEGYEDGGYRSVTDLRCAPSFPSLER